MIVLQRSPERSVAEAADVSGRLQLPGRARLLRSVNASAAQAVRRSDFGSQAPILPHIEAHGMEFLRACVELLAEEKCARAFRLPRRAGRPLLNSAESTM